MLDTWSLRMKFFQSGVFSFRVLRLGFKRGLLNRRSRFCILYVCVYIYNIRGTAGFPHIRF